ncbi:MAG: PKD domain-containing protein [Pseudomonadota bacterium]
MKLVAKHFGIISLLFLIGTAACGDNTSFAPTAKLKIPEFAYLGRPVLLDGSGSTDPDNDIVYYCFCVADGTETKTVPTPTLTHVFRTTGLIEVALEVIDLEGNRNKTNATLSVRNP